MRNVPGDQMLIWSESLVSFILKWCIAQPSRYAATWPLRAAQTLKRVNPVSVTMQLTIALGHRAQSNFSSKRIAVNTALSSVHCEKAATAHRCCT